jgi:hypothetical protein
MATHGKDELRAAARVLARAALQAGFRPGAGIPLAATYGKDVAGATRPARTDGHEGKRVAKAA